MKFDSAFRSAFAYDEHCLVFLFHGWHGSWLHTLKSFMFFFTAVSVLQKFCRLFWFFFIVLVSHILLFFFLLCLEYSDRRCPFFSQSQHSKDRKNCFVRAFHLFCLSLPNFPGIGHKYRFLYSRVWLLTWRTRVWPRDTSLTSQTRGLRQEHLVTFDI